MGIFPIVAIVSIVSQHNMGPIENREQICSQNSSFQVFRRNLWLTPAIPAPARSEIERIADRFVTRTGLVWRGILDDHRALGEAQGLGPWSAYPV